MSVIMTLFMNDNTSISAALAIQMARAQTLEALVEAGFRELGLQEIEGTPISRWAVLRQAAELETYLKLAPNAPDAEQLRTLIQKLRGT